MNLIDDHWELRITRLFSHISLWVFIFIISLLVGILVSVCAEKWEMFGRSGSVATISGLLLMMRPILRCGSVAAARKGVLPNMSVESGEASEKIDPESLRDGRAALLGMIFTIIGTIVWGFGDLIVI